MSPVFRSTEASLRDELLRVRELGKEQAREIARLKEQLAQQTIEAMRMSVWAERMKRGLKKMGKNFLDLHTDCGQWEARAKDLRRIERELRHQLREALNREG